MTTPKHAFDHHSYAIGLKEAEAGVNEAVAMGALRLMWRGVKLFVCEQLCVCVCVRARARESCVCV